MLSGQIGHAGEMRFGDDEKVHGRPGRNIVKGQQLLVFVHLAARDSTRRDFAKNTVMFGAFGGMEKYITGPAKARIIEKFGIQNTAAKFTI